MLPPWLYDLPWGPIQTAASAAGIEHLYVAAIIMAESGGASCATRYEHGWEYHYQVEYFARMTGTTILTEHIGQMTSWGAMQVMGTVAREYGFKGYFPELCTDSVGIKYGCMHLKKFLKKYGSYKDAIAAYNAGSVRLAADGRYVNAEYVDKVIGYYNEFMDFIDD